MGIIRIHTKKSLDGDAGLGKLVDLTEGRTGADIGNMVNTAALSAVREHISADSKFGQHNKNSSGTSENSKHIKNKLRVSKTFPVSDREGKQRE